MGCPRRGGGSVLPTADWAGCHLISVCLSEVCRPRCGRVPEAIEAGAIVTVGNPDGLAVSEAGSRGEAHESVGCLLR